MANINDTFYKDPSVTNPYKGQNKKITQKYDNQYSAYEKQQNKANEALEKKTNDEARDTYHQQYLTYMQNVRKLPSQMAGLGISGGASETSQLQLDTNYQNNRNATTAARDAQLASYREALANRLSQKRADLDALRDAEIETNTQNYNTWNQEQQEQEENRYAQTISGWNDIGAIDKEIARIERTGGDPWRIGYLRARRTELQNAMEEEAAAAGSSGGGGGYSGYYNNTTTEDEQEEEPTTQGTRNGGLAYTAVTGNPNTVAKARTKAKTTARTAASSFLNGGRTKPQTMNYRRYGFRYTR